MSIEEAVLERLKALPPDKQREVLDFAEFLQQRAVQGKWPRQSVKGLWTGLIEKPITEEDIAKARREMWGNFPREDIL